MSQTKTNVELLKSSFDHSYKDKKIAHILQSEMLVELIGYSGGYLFLYGQNSFYHGIVQTDRNTTRNCLNFKFSRQKRLNRRALFIMWAICQKGEKGQKIFLQKF